MYRFFEILPGALAWVTIILMVVLSRFLPVWVAVFIILFDIYWLLKTIYLSLHVRATFLRLKQNLKVDWREELERKGKTEWEDLYHLVVLPTYKEPYEVLQESIMSLKDADYPKERMLVVLATEEKEGDEGRNKVERLRQEFGNSFGAFLASVHPSGLPKEIPGKGSNETWAAKRAKEEIIDERRIPYEKVLVSVFDADTQVPPQYFGLLTHSFLGEERPLRAIYQPVPFFTNNVYEAPPLGRVVSFSATFWQMMQQSRPERLTTFSSQSIPFPVLLDIGYWHTDVVSEDSRIFWQCFLKYDGDFRVVPLDFPVYMDANVAPTFWKTMKNIYRQQRRWAWGVENTPYLLEGFRKNPRIPFKKKLHWALVDLEGRHSWATSALMIFALGWLPVVLGGEAFGVLLISYNLPLITRYIINLSMIGVATSAILSVVLLPPRPDWFKKRHYLLYVLEWVFLPVTLIVFGAFPAIDAQTRLMLGGKRRLGFWVTPKGRYTKERKVTGA